MGKDVAKNGHSTAVNSEQYFLTRLENVLFLDEKQRKSIFSGHGHGEEEGAGDAHALVGETLRVVSPRDGLEQVVVGHQAKQLKGQPLPRLNAVQPYFTQS